MNNSTDERIETALKIAFRYSQIDGEHHKAWSIDQMVRALLGSEESYNKFVRDYEDDGEYEWDAGMAP